MASKGAAAASSARAVILGNGVELPRVGLGTFRVRGGDVGTSVAAALRAGIRCFDTAAIYKNEKELAAALRSCGVSREEVFITSKISPYQQGTEKAAAACEEILGRLETDFVDLMLIHWPGVSKTPLSSEANAEKRRESWQVLERFYCEGRAIGVSNYELRHLEELWDQAAIKPMVNQFECHPRYPQVQLRRRCQELGVAVVAYASLGQGELLQNTAVRSVASRRHKTPAQVLLRWGLDMGCCVIPKSVTPERVRAFTEDQMLSWELSGQDLEELAALGDDPVKFCWDPAEIR